ncbi:MAG: DUF2760 domain-containing protein [Methylococcales bacterium]|nr:DUF2760 domain-containing protein [Methylococcales bacterium]
MNNIYPINLSLIPATLDLWHVCLIAMVLFLAITLIIIVLAGLIKPGFKKKAKQAEPEIKIVEKIVEVEKMVQIPAPEPVVLKQATSDAALQLLGMLQKEARFIDFIKEDVSAYSDADVGVAARVVHEGCNKAINEYFTLETVRTETEGSNVKLKEGFDATEVRLTGNVVGEGPYKGILVHKGWQVTDIRLPKLTAGHNAKIIAAAEVEL